MGDVEEKEGTGECPKIATASGCKKASESLDLPLKTIRHKRRPPGCYKWSKKDKKSGSFTPYKVIWNKSKKQYKMKSNARDKRDIICDDGVYDTVLKTKKGSNDDDDNDDQGVSESKRRDAI